MKINALKKLIFVFAFGLSVSLLNAQPEPPVEHGSVDDEIPGGGAPLGEGIALLTGMGLAWAGRKIYYAVKHEEED